jgi:hypothetical protein
MSEPYTLMKFRPVNKYLLDSLVKSQLFFASPARLNDPFDCRVDLKKALQNAIDQSSSKEKENLSKLIKMEGFFNKLGKDVGNCGICSFSLELLNSLLWSHYADGHKGICLTYRFDESYIIDPSNEIIGIADVKYETNPLTEWFKIKANELPNLKFDNFFEEIIKTILTIKDDCWGHEKEIRIIRKAEGTLELQKNSCNKYVLV